MHGKAKCSDRFLWAVIKVCKILLRFFLAGFEYWLFKLELGCYSSFLLILPKLVVPPHKSPGAMAFIQNSLATTPSVASLIWLSSKMTESIFFLPFLLASLSYPQRACVHTHTQTHRFTNIGLSLWAETRKGSYAEQSVPEDIPPVKLEPLIPGL